MKQLVIGSPLGNKISEIEETFLKREKALTSQAEASLFKAVIKDDESLIEKLNELDARRLPMREENGVVRSLIF